MKNILLSIVLVGVQLLALRFLVYFLSETSPNLEGIVIAFLIFYSAFGWFLWTAEYEHYQKCSAAQFGIVVPLSFAVHLAQVSQYTRKSLIYLTKFR